MVAERDRRGSVFEAAQVTWDYVGSACIYCRESLFGKVEGVDILLLR